MDTEPVHQLHANLSSCCDFVPMVQGTGSLGMAGPPLIRASMGYGVDDVIHPSDTRAVLIQAIRMMGEKLRLVGIPPKKRAIVPW